MKKLLCVICLLAAVLFVNTADACMTGRCGSYGRSFYSRSYSHGRSYAHYGHNFGGRRHFGGHSYGHYGHRFGGRSYGHYGRHFGGHRYSRCTRCGYRR